MCTISCGKAFVFMKLVGVSVVRFDSRDEIMLGKIKMKVVSTVVLHKGLSSAIKISYTVRYIPRVSVDISSFDYLLCVIISKVEDRSVQAECALGKIKIK